MLVNDGKLSAMPKLDASGNRYCKVTCASDTDAGFIRTRFNKLVVPDKELSKSEDDVPSSTKDKGTKEPKVSKPARIDPSKIPSLKTYDFVVQGVEDMDNFNTDLKELVGKYNGVLGRDK